MKQKDSFILYTEQKEVIDKLSDEQAGKIIKALYSYAKDGTMPQLDAVLDLVIIPFKSAIDRNDIKWQETKKKRSEAGKKGMLERWKDIEENNGTKNIITKDNNVKNVITEITKDNNVKNDITKITKITDNVHVNVPDNVSVHVNDNVNVNDNIESNISIKNKKINKDINKGGIGGKGKEREKEEKIYFAEFVAMTNTEYKKLVSTYSKGFADQCIIILDNYKGANGKKYKSDYRAILNWVVDKAKQDNIKNGLPAIGNSESEEDYIVIDDIPEEEYLKMRRQQKDV